MLRQNRRRKFKQLVQRLQRAADRVDDRESHDQGYQHKEQVQHDVPRDGAVRFPPPQEFFPVYLLRRIRLLLTHVPTLLNRLWIALLQRIMIRNRIVAIAQAYPISNLEKP